MNTKMFTNNTNKIEREELSLYELSSRIKGVINRNFANQYWVRAEMSDVRPNASGHCYLEFIEKNTQTGQLVAKVRASIWARTFNSLRPYFEQVTGQRFMSGLKVLVKVSVEYHELYGFSLNVLDIDPAYTVGDMIRRRMEIISRLQKDGVYTLNKELPFPTLPQRIALITSETAAGYEDFVNQLIGNRAGYVFYLKLFPAIMQGEKTESSIIAALEHIYKCVDMFDLVVIIRGGGATSELSSFDTYDLAANCAQFPLPIVTGIGHERDDTVLDLVANTRMKTPTAVAEFLIGRMDTVANELNAMQQSVVAYSTDLLQREKNRLQLLGNRLPSIAINRIERNRSQLQMLGNRLPVATSNLLNRHSNQLLNRQTTMQQSLQKQLADKNHFLKLTEQFIKMASPDYILKRGYSMTLKDGKIVKRTTAFTTGDELTTRFIDGDVKSRVL
ncbi:exodeoxyribonuclease 7 large subunit [Bacteroidia bacterium]|nr:exodeoxyribonuclease 7 large subunit [Bacteroidia bacterium]GHU57990.1 exodeoxyribonuclease 7 large subunit [Bacteroidia bacterium]